MPIWELISSRWLVNQSLWSSKKLTRFSHFWPWCKWLSRQNLELNPYTKEEWCHSTHTRHRLTGTTYKTFWLLKPKLFDECWVNANLTSLYSNINHCNRYHYQENWNKHELYFAGFVYLWKLKSWSVKVWHNLSCVDSFLNAIHTTTTEHAFVPGHLSRLPLGPGQKVAFVPGPTASRASGGQRSFVPGGGSNGNKRTPFCPGWWLHPG